ncbi:MAG: pyridoxal phosphate-dependent aminotransferase [Chloroflexaceae bacterium]|nr:pyridoxal phosphate-dependent aminotransferase [Chloroflexaceae bacterium]
MTTPTVRLSKRLAQLEPSATAAMGGRIAQMKAQGVNVISFSIGEPDFDTPSLAKNAAIDALHKNHTHYTPTGGIADLRKAVAARASSDQGVKYSPNQISVTTGAKEALYLAFQALIDEGDEVIIPAPYWVSYVEQVKLAGGVPVVVETTEANGFRMTAEQLAAHLSPRTRMLVLNSPSNPTGAVYSEAELAGLAAVLRENESEALVMTDEIYDAICYVPYARWLRVAPDFAERTLVVNGASKAFAMTGWRIGYIAGPEAYIEAIKSIQSHSTTHPASIAQYAALAAYTPSTEIDAAVDGMVRAFKERRDLIMEALDDVPGVTCSVPDGAFYVFPNVSGLLNRPLAGGTVCASSDELTMYLLEQAHIGVVSGESFGAPGYLRLSYATSNAEISEGMRRFAAAVKG